MNVEVEPETGTCDFNPEMATMGEWARGRCNSCGQPLALHLTPDQWASLPSHDQLLDDLRPGSPELGTYDANDPWLNERCDCGHVRYWHLPGGEAGTLGCTECECPAFCSLPSHDQEQP